MKSSVRSRISRRGLIGSGVAAALLANTGFPLRAQPRRGGRLRAALPGRLGPDGHGVIHVAATIGTVFDTLIEIAPDGTLRGELALAWQPGAEARVWTLDLREDAVFHDGRAFLSEDAVASLRYHMRHGLDDVQRRLAQIETVKRLSRNRLRITLRNGNVDFPYVLSDHRLPMLPAGAEAAALANGNGTGLYRAVPGAKPGRFLAERISQHFRDGQTGWFDEAEFIAVNDPADALDLLCRAQVDVVADIGSAGKRALTARGFSVFEAERDSLQAELSPDHQTSSDTQARGLHHDQQDLREASSEVKLRGAHRANLHRPDDIGTILHFDDARLAERWWFA